LRQAAILPGLVLAVMLVSAPCSAFEVGEGEQFGLARKLLGEGDYFRAITEFKRFLFFFPQSGQADEARLGIAESLLAAGRLEEACAAFEEFRKLRPEGPEADRALLGQALALLKQGRRQEGRELLRGLFKGGLRSRAQLELAFSLAEEGEWARAKEELSRVSEPGPELERRLTALSEGEAGAKSPAAAGLLSALLPGAGQFYCGRVRDAGLALLVNGLFIWGAAEAGSRDNWPLAAGLGLIEMAWYGGTIYGAVNCAYKHEQDEARRLRERLEGSPEAGRGLLLAWGYRF
jgi:tetratricopeptide (TPR) repeat protein